MAKHRIIKQTYLSDSTKSLFTHFVVQYQKSFLGIKYWQSYMNINETEELEFESYEEALKYMDRAREHKPGTIKRVVLHEID